MEQKGRVNRITQGGGEALSLLKKTLGRLAMGEIRAKVRLENYGDRVLFKAGRLAESDIRVQEIEAVADTGAVETLLPQELAEALGLETFGTVTVGLADDSRIELPKAGTLALTVAGRVMHTDCLVGPAGCEPLIGQLVMEALDLIADPRRKTLTVRPESPDRPTLKMKGGLRVVSSHFTDYGTKTPAQSYYRYG